MLVQSEQNSGALSLFQTAVSDEELDYDAESTQTKLLVTFQLFATSA